MRFGFATTTYDIDGEAVADDVRPELDPARVEEIFQTYLGKVRQTLPPFSAKKIHGRPMYAYARKGVALAPATKEVTIKQLKLLSVKGCEVEFELGCAAGTYARSLAHDVGRDYGCGAHLIRLRRVRSGEFPIEAAVPLTDGTSFPTREFFLSRIVPLRSLLTEMPAIVISTGDRSRLTHGVDLHLLTSAYDSDEYRLLDESGELLALGERLQTFASPVAQPAQWVRIHPRIIFN
jgi:tRNA pseudouridine55 synthase